MITFSEALNNYYEFKTLYETSYNKEKRDIINNKKLSWDEKRNRFQKLKPKCINCKRPVGTIFSRKFSEDEYSGYKTLLAVCGDRVKPCKLNINLKLENVETLEDNIKYLDDSIEEDKNIIIQKKNELLFGYISSQNAIDTFEIFKTELNDTYELKNYYLELLISKTDNEEKKKELNKLLVEYYVTIKNIRQDVKDAILDNNFQLIEDTIRNNYVDILMTKSGTSENPAYIGILDKIRNLKYMYNVVDYDENTNKFHLIQKKNTIESLEAPHSNEVISYVFGVFESKSKTKKTSKKEVKSKTRKLRIEEDESPPVTVVEKLKELVIQSKSPIIGEDGSITWQDENYKKAWARLSQKHKDYLAKYPDWLQESMDSYAKNIIDMKSLKFINPPNLILPPKKLEDGTYDFGNEVYNKAMYDLEELNSWQRHMRKTVVLDYFKDLERKDISKEKANEWFKNRIEEAVYEFFYPIRTQLVVR